MSLLVLQSSLMGKREVVALLTLSSQGAGGGGGTLFFSAYVGSDPASTVHPKKISEISNTPKKYFATPKNNPILYINLKKRP